MIVFPAIALSGLLAACAAATRPTAPVELSYPRAGLPDSAVADARRAARAYVAVTIQQNAAMQSGRGHGAARRVVNGASGIVVDPSGYVVTAAHIAKSTDFVARVFTLDGREHPARIVHVAPRHEMALLKIEAHGASFAAAVPARGTRAGQRVFAVGTPDGRRGDVAVGRLAEPRLERRVGYGEYSFENPVSLNLDIAPGYSGGPVFDVDGHLVGMIYAFDLRATAGGTRFNAGTAYAVPATEVMLFARRWSRGARE